MARVIVIVIVVIFGGEVQLLLLGVVFGMDASRGGPIRMG